MPRPYARRATAAPATAPIVVMGVSGSGKSTVGALLERRLGMPFVDADELHPAASRARMAGVPLDDAGRWPWLDAVGARLAGSPAPVVACSALRRAYRDRLRTAAPDAVFVHLTGPASLVAGRIARRRHPFMPPGLLASQYATLEPLGPDERGVAVEVAVAPPELVDEIVAGLPDQGTR